jgi:hypothetical protein
MGVRIALGCQLSLIGRSRSLFFFICWNISSSGCHVRLILLLLPWILAS